MSSILALVTRVVSLPFTLLSLVLARVLGVRRLPSSLRLSSWTSGTTGNGSNGTEMSMSMFNDGDSIIIDPEAASAWFLRYIKTCDPDPDGQGVDSKLWYIQGGYNAALRRAKEDCQVLCVVLTSKEHDDNATFMRHTLCTPAFKRIMQEHKGEIVFWGGDVCTSRDAHVAATILQAATFPFVAFLSMQPTPPSRITGSSPPSSSSSKMTVFSRLEGLQATSIQQITSHITETMAPRLNPFLGRLRAQKRERESQRSLREEQDRAYEQAGKKDLERVRAKEAELRAKRAEEQAKKDAEDQARTQQEMKAREGVNRQAWRRKTAFEFGPEPPEGTKLVIRLPDGRRLMRRFRDDEDAMRIWYYIECEAFDVHVNDPSVSTSSTSVSTTNYTPDITFSLATTFPRRLLKPDAARNKTVGDLVSEGLLEKKVASVIVEGLKLKQDDAGTDEEIEEEEED